MKTMLTVKVRDGKVHVDDANVTKTDTQASNGVIHVFDTVILPKGIWPSGDAEDLDGLAGTGLESISDESRRWSMPITGGITFRF
jgi:hypothetical protein